MDAGMVDNQSRDALERKVEECFTATQKLTQSTVEHGDGSMSASVAAHEAAVI